MWEVLQREVLQREVLHREVLQRKVLHREVLQLEALQSRPSLACAPVRFPRECATSLWERWSFS